jgi:hypothetical protein
MVYAHQIVNHDNMNSFRIIINIKNTGTTKMNAYQKPSRHGEKETKHRKKGK